MCACAARFRAIAGRTRPATSISTSRTSAPRIDGVIWKGVSRACAFSPKTGWRSSPPAASPPIPARRSTRSSSRRWSRPASARCWRQLEERRRSSPPKACSTRRASSCCRYLPTVIGVVTSPTGAVIRDILHRLGDRFPRHVLVWPVRVQGDGCGARGRCRDSRASTRCRRTGAIPRPDLHHRRARRRFARRPVVRSTTRSWCARRRRA